MRYAYVLLVVLLMGCVQFSNFNTLLGGAAQEESKPEDVLLIKDLLVIPKSPVTAGSEFTLTYQVNSVLTAPGSKEIDGATAEAYDSGRCKASEAKKSLGKLFPGSTEIVSWKFTTPSNSDLGGLEAACNVRFKISYKYDALSVIDATIVSKEKYEKSQRAGETLSVIPKIQKGAGPVKINIGYDRTAQPFIAGSNVPVSIVIQDLGKGLLNGVEKDKIKVSFEDGTKIDCDYPTSKIGSKEMIPLIKKVSPPIKCSFKAPDTQDTRSLFLRVEIPQYDYELHDSARIDVKPAFEGIKK